MSEPAPFTEEDRARAEGLIRNGGMIEAAMLARALAYIEQLEGALREIAERECEDFEDWEEEGTQRCPDFDFDRWCASCLARAALPTSKED